MGHGETNAIHGLCGGLSVGVDILAEQCSAGPISGIDFSMGSGLEAALVGTRKNRF
jgi:hypothetical protein